jgi:hypothetical protein
VYRFLLAVLLAAPVFGEIPDSVLAEDNLEKRSELALKAADERITAAIQAYAKTAGLEEFESQLAAAGALTELSLKSLQDSGKRARKNPKYFKRAEKKLRSISRRLDTLETEVSAADRPPVEKLKKLVSETHDQILHDIMSKR